MVSDTTGHAAARRRRRHPRRAPHPRPRGRALVHDDRGAGAVRRAPRLPRRTATGSCSTASAPAAGTSPSRTGRPSSDGRVGVWHHIAYDAGDGEEIQRARDEANEGVRPWTKIFDHYFFDSCYSMSPGGRMEICTTGPGFQLDEKLEDLGDRLCLSPRVEPLRAKLESELTPIVNPRPRSKKKAAAKPPRATAPRRRSLRPSPELTLSFDNGPDPEATPRVLDVLAERGLKATFFVVGEQLRAHRALAERAHAEGHWIGNHTLTHPRPLGERRRRARARSRRRRRCSARSAPRAPVPPVGRGRRPRAGPAQPAASSTRWSPAATRACSGTRSRATGRTRTAGSRPRCARSPSTTGRCSSCTTSRAPPPTGSRSSSTARRRHGPPGLPARLRPDPRRRGREH